MIPKEPCQPPDRGKDPGSGPIPPNRVAPGVSKPHQPISSKPHRLDVRPASHARSDRSGPIMRARHPIGAPPLHPPRVPHQPVPAEGIAPLVQCPAHQARVPIVAVSSSSPARSSWTVRRANFGRRGSSGAARNVSLRCRTGGFGLAA